MIFRRRKNILIERFDEQTLVFDLEKNLPYVLNGVASYVLAHTDGLRSQEEIAEKVCLEFDVEFPEALDDIRGLYEEFARRNLVHPMD